MSTEATASRRSRAQDRAGSQPSSGPSLLGMPSREALVDLKDLVEKDALRSVIERTYPLDAVADAIRHVEAGGVAGKITVTVGAGEP